MRPRNYIPDTAFTRPVLVVSLILLIAALLIASGFWQLDRARRSADELRLYQARSILPILVVGESELDIGTERFRLAEVTGTYLPEHSLLLANRISAGRSGYHVYTPISLVHKDSRGGGPVNRAVLVNRGWVSTDGEGVKLSPVNTPEGELTIKGRLNLPPSRPRFFGDGDVVATGTVWQYINLGDVSAWTGLYFEPMIMELDPSLQGAGGYLREWPVLDDALVARHNVFAWLCFALALAVVIFPVGVRVRRNLH